MKPEVRRALAKEWLILMTIALVVTFCRVGWFYYKNNEIERRFRVHQIEYELPTIEDLKWELIKADLEGNTKEAKAFADAIRQMQAQPSQAPTKSMKELAGKKMEAANYERWEYPSPLTKQFWSVSATWAVEWSWLAYLALWVPRLTVSSIRLLRTNSNSAKAN
jgi:hypothetical protein